MAAHRCTLLNPRFAQLYPEIPSGVWLPAWQTSMRRAERIWRERGAEALLAGRLLPDEHFRFRGGVGYSRRRVLLERLGDPCITEDHHDSSGWSPLRESFGTE